MGYKKNCSVWYILAVLAIVSNEMQIADASKKYNECLKYCKNEFNKDPITCFIFCSMKCMPSLGNECSDTGVGRFKVPVGSKPAIGEEADANPPASPVLKSIAQSPLPQFFQTMKKRSSIPELQQFLRSMAPNSALPPSPSPSPQQFLESMAPNSYLPPSPSPLPSPSPSPQMAPNSDLPPSPSPSPSPNSASPPSPSPNSDLPPSPNSASPPSPSPNSDLPPSPSN